MIQIKRTSALLLLSLFSFFLFIGCSEVENISETIASPATPDAFEKRAFIPAGPSRAVLGNAEVLSVIPENGSLSHIGLQNGITSTPWNGLP